MNFKRLLKRETGTWVLAILTIVVGGFSVWTGNVLYETRNKLQSRPEATGNCTLSYSIATPTPASCTPCRYQTDIFWGPVILDGQNASYNNTGRLIGSIRNTTLPLCNVTVAAPISGPTVPTLSANCADPVGRGYLTSTQFARVNPPSGYVSATIRNTTKGCTYQVGHAVYKVGGTNGTTQNLNDYRMATLGPGQSITLDINAPMNNDAPSCHTTTSTPSPVVTPTGSVATPTSSCTTVTPYDPPHGICAENGTIGSAFWEWRHIPNVEQYEVDIYRADGTLVVDNDWRNIADFNCGVIPSKCTYVTNNLPVGSYYSRVRARGGQCMQSNWHQSITIIVSSCSDVISPIVASEDSYTDSGRSGMNYGNSSSLSTVKSPANKITYLKFNLSSLAGRTITSAKLKLRVSDASANSMVVKEVANTSWTESTITAANRPALGSTIKSFVARTANTFVEIDLTNHIRLNSGRVITLAIDSSSGNDLFRSLSSETTTVSLRPTIVIN